MHQVWSSIDGRTMTMPFEHADKTSQNAIHQSIACFLILDRVMAIQWKRRIIKKVMPPIFSKKRAQSIPQWNNVYCFDPE